MSDIVMPAPFVIPHMPAPVLIPPIVAHEGEQQQPQVEDVPNVEAPRRSRELEDQLLRMTMNCIILKSLIWRVILLRMKKPQEAFTHRNG